jgi:hypothetical protein
MPSPIGLARSNLVSIAAICIRNPNLHIGWSYEVFCKKIFVLFYSSGVLGEEARQMSFLPSGLNHAPPS